MVPGRAWARRVVPLLIVAAAVLTAPAFAEGPADKKWRDGPVSYLLSDEEHRQFGRLKTAPAREAFIEQFWWRLDPDPGTSANEFRERFDRLCESANVAFLEPISPGWRTERGRVLLLLGEPDSIRRDAGDAWSRVREIWTYNHPPGAIPGPLEVVFHRHRNGEFRLRREDVQTLREDPVARERRRQRLRWQLRNERLALSPAAADQLVRVLFESSEPFFDPLPPRGGSTTRAIARDLDGPVARSSAMEESAYFFQAVDGSVLALLALDLHPGDGLSWDPSSSPEPSPYIGRAWIRGEGGETSEVALEPSRAHGREGSLLFTGRVYVKPGTYGVRYAVADSLNRSLAVRSDVLEVPELGPGRFRASSVVPAERFGHIAEGEISPFAVGSEEVVPRPAGEFHQGEPLRIYLQVYGAEEDPHAGKPRVDVKFVFERALRHRFKVHGKPLLVRGAEGASMGLALPIGDWPVGDYRVVVELHDRVSGQRTSSQGTFRIRD